MFRHNQWGFALIGFLCRSHIDSYSIEPLVHDTYNLGTATKRWNEVHAKTANFNDIHLSGQIIHPVVAGGEFISVVNQHSFNFDCNVSMTQHLDGDTMNGPASITFSNQQEGTTYVILFIQGLANYSLSLPSGWWLNDSEFDFTTLSSYGRALITATYIYDAWHFSVKNLLFVL